MSFHSTPPPGLEDLGHTGTLGSASSVPTRYREGSAGDSQQHRPDTVCGKGKTTPKEEMQTLSSRFTVAQ